MNAIVSQPTAGALESVLIGGDLSKLSVPDRVMYYKAVCESVGLNPLTKPFEYITLNNKLTLYARRDATDQLRQIHKVSITILEREVVEDCYVVTARANTPIRQDESIGAVNIHGLKGESRANAMMKAETKAKRRVTLSVCGLGMLDETEVDSIPGARTSVTAGYLEAQPAKRQEVIIETATEMKAFMANGQLADAYAMWQTSKFDAEEEIALWSLFPSDQRSMLKRMEESERAHESGAISPSQKKRLEAIIKERGLVRDDVKAECVKRFGKGHFAELTREEYEIVCTEIESAPPQPVQDSPALPQDPDSGDGADPLYGVRVSDISDPDPARSKLESCGSLSALAATWRTLTPDDRKRLEAFKDECKARIEDADRVAT